MANGIITRKDLIEDQAMSIGPDYAKGMQQAITANKELVSSLKEMAPLINAFRKTDSQQAYVALKQQENIITLQAINANKLQEATELSLDKIKRQKLITEKAALDLENKKEAIKKRNTQLTIEERIQNEINNRLLKQEARERLGLVGAYEKLNRSRTEAQKRLADLLAAENKNTEAIKVAKLEYEKLDARVKAVDAATKNYSKEIGNYRGAFEGLNGTLKELISTFGLVTGVALFGTILSDIFTIVKDFDRQLIAVGKTTNLTGEDLKQFGREVVELGDRLDGISVDGLIQSAEVAGQLGVTGTSNILKFSEAIEKLKLTSNIISEEQVGQFAKFIEVSSDSFENADRLASVITQLGNSFATTEAEVLGNATEIQKGIAVYNTSAQGVLALGAATSTLGSEAESSRSAIQTTFAVINNATATGAKLEKVLKLTNLTQKELSEQFNTDATGVFQKFVKGLNTAKNEGQNLSLVLNDLGITEKRAFTVVGSLAANYGVLESAMAQASDEYTNNIALNKEVAAASQSIASIIGDIRDKFEAYVLATNDANSGTEAITKTLKFFRDNLKGIIDGFLKYGSVIITFLAIQKSLNFITVTYNALKIAGTAAQISFTTATGLGTVAMKAQAQAAREATIAQEGLNLAVKTTPWGIILAALTAAVVAYMVFNDQLSESEVRIQNIVEANKRLQDSEKNYSEERDKSNADRFKAIEDDIKLRKAQGENSNKLDKEEIERKKEILQAQISVYSNLKNVELERTKTEIQQSENRISQMKKESSALANSGFRVSKQGRTVEQLTDLIDNEKEKLNAKRALLSENSKLTTQEQARLLKMIQDLDKNAAVKDAENKAEADKKAIEARKKYLKEIYDANKKASDDNFKLSQFRLQVAIEMEDEILKNEKASLNDRVDALSEYQQLVTAKTKEAAEFELQQLGKYNEKTGKLVRELSDKEINILLNDGQIKRKLTSEQLLILEKYQNEQTRLKQKGVDDRQKIIDNQVDNALKDANSTVQNQDTELSRALEAENIKFRAITDGQQDIREATEEHERQILAIKELYAKKALQVQIDAIQKLLDQQDTVPESEKISADKRAKIENDLAKYKLQLSEFGIEDYAAKAQRRVELELEAAGKIKELANNLTFALVDLTNTIFDARIQNIDNQIAQSNELYAKESELAGNDARKKDFIDKERAKKEKALQLEKQKEIIKQAIFNKVIATAEIGLNLAKTITALNLAAAQLDAISFGTAGTPYRAIQIPLAIGLAAAQTAVVLATPIPKYKMGRKGGPAEVAEVGDGGVHEVVSRPDGSGARVTPNKPTLTFLQKDDIVHKSVADYNEYMRRSIMKSFYKEKELASTYQIISNSREVDNSDILIEIKEAIKKQKTNVQINNKIDFGYQNYRNSNINWRA